MKSSIIIILSALFFCAGSCYAGDKRVTSAANPWAPFVDPESPGQGLSIEIVKAAFAAEGYTLEHRFMPWARAEQEVRKGQIDILPNTWYSKERIHYYKFSKAYAANQIKFIKKKWDPFEYNGIESLTGKSVGVIMGYAYNDEFMNATNFKREGVSRFVLNIQKLIRGRIDLTLEDEIVAKSILNKEAPELLEQIEFTQNVLARNDLYIVCSIENSRCDMIIKAFNKGLEAIKADGTITRIFEQNHIKQ